MTRKFKPIMAALSLAAVMSFASNVYAVTYNILFNAAGSSGAFNAMGVAAGLGTSGSGPGVCGGHNWTKKKGTATGVDGRSSSIGAAGGPIWIVWSDPSGAGVVTVCSYLSVDSIVGARLFFAVPRGTLSLGTASGSSGDSIVPLLPADVALDAGVFGALNGQAFNAAPSDIRPEDCKFGTTRALTALGPTGLGYGPGPIGMSILSAFSSASSQVVDFNISGTDPITSQTVPPFTTANVGAQVVVIVVNTSDTSSGGFGTAAFNNVDRFVLAKVQDGTLTRTRDLIPSSGLPSIGIQVLNREPLSGTFNTEEFSVPRNKEINTTQELNVNPAVAGGNPLDLTASDGSGSTRKRVIGTGEMLTELGAVSDSLGYTFWSFGNGAKVATTAKYLTVDGVDPLQASYTGGAMPSCTPPCVGALTYPNVINGSYPIWNVLRVITGVPEPAGVASLISAAQTQVTKIPDFVPIASLQVFRSHYTQAGLGCKNGHLARSKEQGGDMGGAVFTVQADFDNITDTGKELCNFKQ